MNDTISLSCDRCGSKDFKLPAKTQSQLKSDDVISCAKCGAAGKYGDIIAEAKKKAIADIESRFKKIFK